MGLIRVTVLFLISLSAVSFCYPRQEEVQVLSYKINPAEHDLRFFLSDEKGRKFRSIANLKRWVEGKGLKLVFVMNGGMYQKDGSPLGLYIENHSVVKALNHGSGEGNFYMKPNGVFYLDRKMKAGICITEQFRNSFKAKYATQSGPMLLKGGVIHSEFKKESSNVNIRNGVGLKPDGNLIFAMSEEPVNFYDFALWFREQGCIDALYLDGAISRTYLPEQGANDLGGNFGVIIAMVSKK